MIFYSRSFLNSIHKITTTALSWRKALISFNLLSRVLDSSIMFQLSNNKLKLKKLRIINCRNYPMGSRRDPVIARRKPNNMVNMKKYIAIKFHL